MPKQSPHHCSDHDTTHVHRPGCGHARVQHEDHFCYVVGNHLHYVKDGRCVFHGAWPEAPERRK